MKVELNLLMKIILIFFIILIISIFSFGIIIIIKSLWGVIDFKGILVGAFLNWFSLIHLTILLELNSFELKNNEIILRKIILKEEYISELKDIQYRDIFSPYSFSSENGILIKINNQIVDIFPFRYSNSKNFIEIIKNNCEKDESIKPKIWTKHLKKVFSVGLYIHLGLLILLLFS